MKATVQCRGESHCLRQPCHADTCRCGTQTIGRVEEESHGNSSLTTPPIPFPNGLQQTRLTPKNPSSPESTSDSSRHRPAKSQSKLPSSNRCHQNRQPPEFRSPRSQTRFNNVWRKKLQRVCNSDRQDDIPRHWNTLYTTGNCLNNRMRILQNGGPQPLFGWSPVGNRLTNHALDVAGRRTT